ncbi:MAG: methylmalonyl Co-A mutase-associated GTPase MeaB [Acidobacteria bacterium]|nr:methylmalonyl Co-A mutase-associated GTPase MeaB [Acidobacteriota bacterium]
MTADGAPEAWLDGPEPWRETRRLARALTAIERGAEAAWARAAFRRAGRAMTVGLTGPPGVGKSTLTAALARELRKRGEPVAVLAFDPTSPLTGGAVLGDRVRMSGLETDPGVFIRSMASRGASGGLARAAAAAADLLDAAGFRWILVETVGAGQAQTLIRRNADLVVLVVAPGLGDGVQAIKSGTMEIADVFVVNKGDLAGAGAARLAIEDAASPEPGGAGGRRPVVSTVARTGEGTAELLEAMSGCFDGLEAGGEIAARRAARFRRRVLDLYRAEVLRLAMDAVESGRLVAEAGDPERERALYGAPESQQNRAPGNGGQVDPYDLADRLVAEFVGGFRRDGGSAHDHRPGPHRDRRAVD